MLGGELRLRLASRIDSEVNFDGDILEATLDRLVRDTQGGTIPAGTVVRGHLAQVEKVNFPNRQVVLAIRFDTMVLDGTPVPVKLVPRGKMDQRGREMIRFPGSKLVLGPEFIWRWRVQ